MYLLSILISDNFTESLIILGANNRGLVLNGDFYRLITCAFLHGSVLHLFVNMYSLWIIGSQVENYIGKILLKLIPIRGIADYDWKEKDFKYFKKIFPKVQKDVEKGLQSLEYLNNKTKNN